MKTLTRLWAVLLAAFFVTSIAGAHTSLLASLGRSPIGVPQFSVTGKPYAVALANGTAEVYGGQCRVVGIRVYGNGATARTAAFYDSAGGNPTGGTLLGTVTIPADSGPHQIDVNWLCRYGLQQVVSGTGASAEVLIEGANPSGNPFAVDDGTVLFSGNLTPSASSRTDATTVTTDTTYVREGTSSLRITAANPNGDVSVTFNQATQTGVASVAPADMARNFAVDIYVASTHTYNNGTVGGTGPFNIQLRLTDGTNQYNSAARSVGIGWNRIMFYRSEFTTGAGSPSWASHTFTSLEVRFQAGTSTSPNLDIYLDAIRMNVAGSGPTPVMLDSDDGWNYSNYFGTILAKYPSVKINSFLVKNFSDGELDKYATLAEWKRLKDSYSSRVYLGWHSVTHAGPTALEALTSTAFAEQQLTPWTTWFRTVISPSDFSGEIHGVTPNGQDSAAMRSAFSTAGFVTNRTVRDGVNHPWGIRASRYDLRIANMTGSGTYPADYATAMKGAELTNCLIVYLFHRLGSEDGGTPIDAGSSSLNLTPVESDAIFWDLQKRDEAGLIKMLRRDEMGKYLNMSLPTARG